MKIISILALLFGVSAAAQFTVAQPVGDQEHPNKNVQYDSWCEGDTIKAENEDGQIVSGWDCSEINESTRCVENAVKKGEWTIISATCR